MIWRYDAKNNGFHDLYAITRISANDRKNEHDESAFEGYGYETKHRHKLFSST